MADYNYANFTAAEVEDEAFSAFKTALDVGGPAPDGDLVDAHSGETVRLSDLWKRDNVVIEFGSIT